MTCFTGTKAQTLTCSGAGATSAGPHASRSSYLLYQYKSTHTDAGAVEQDTSARGGGGDGGQAEAEELAALRGQVKPSIYALMEP